MHLPNHCSDPESLNFLCICYRVCVCSVLNNRHYSVACHVKALMHSLPFSAPAKPRPNSPGIATAVSEIVEHLFVVPFHNTLLFLQKKRSVQRAQSDSNTLGCKYILISIYFLTSTSIDSIKRRWRPMTLKVPSSIHVVLSQAQPNTPGIATAVSEIVEHLFVVPFHNTLLFLPKKACWEHKATQTH